MDPETIQHHILKTLDASGTIANTSSLIDKAGTKIDQQLILGVLKRLASHEVHCPSFC